MLTGFALAPLLALLLGAEEPRPAVQVTTIEQRIIMRVPVRRHPPGGPWEERDGPRCIGARWLAGAMLSGPDRLDFLLRNGRRMRARLDSGCPTLDFYGGFYVQPDGERICAGRDVIHSRMGASCRIERFLRLVPATRIP